MQTFIRYKKFSMRIIKNILKNSSASLTSKINIFTLLSSKIGIRQAIIYRIKNKFFEIQSKLGINVTSKCFQFSVKGYKYPLWTRYDTSDIHVLYQIFVHQEYSCLSDINNPQLIIDCGD